MFQKYDAYVLLSEENRFYFTGFKSTFGCVILSKNERYFLTDARYAAEAITLIKDFIIQTTTGARLFSDINKILTTLGVKNVGYEDECITVAEFKRLKAELETFTLKPASGDIGDSRAIKTDSEVRKIVQAEELTAQALERTIPMIKAGVTEIEVSNEITYQMLRLGAQGPSFENIVAFGRNTANPHHHPTNKRLDRNDLITIDIGAKLNGYCGDMTRTFCLGTPHPKLVKIHKIVMEAQEYVLKNIFI